MIGGPQTKKECSFCRVPQFGQRRNSKLINLSKCTKVQSKVLLADLPPSGFYPEVGYRLFFLGQLPCFAPVKLAFSPWKTRILLGKTSIFAMQTSISPGETPPVNRTGHLSSQGRRGAGRPALRGSLLADGLGGWHGAAVGCWNLTGSWDRGRDKPLW